LTSADVMAVTTYRLSKNDTLRLVATAKAIRLN